MKLRPPVLSLRSAPALIDLVLVSHHTAAECVRLVAALDADGVRALFHVLVLENGSPPGELAILQRDLPGATLLASTRNLGFAGGVNALAGQARTEWLLLVNPDLVPFPGLFDRLLRLLPNDPALAVLGGVRAGDGPRSYGEFPSLLGRFRPSPPLARRGEVDWVSGCFMLVRRAAFEALGGLDPGYFMQLEDADFCWRARRAGWRAEVDPELSFGHAGHLSYARSGRTLARDWRAARCRFFARTGRPFAALACRCLDVLRPLD